MKRRSTGSKAILLVAAMALAPYAAQGVFAQSTHQHDHAGASHGESALKLNNGRKWATDAALRQGMDRIRASLAQRVDAAHADKLTGAQYRAVSGEIGQQVAYIVSNCKLEPAADAALHVIIADLMAAADAMSGKSPGTAPRTGFVRALAALDAYSEHFEHPRWVAVKH